MDNLFDFTDVSDVSEELQKRLSGGGRVSPNIVIYADIVKAAAKAGAGSLSISMIECVASRMKLPSISQQTMRNALVSAVKAGLIVKPSRQTYGVSQGTEVAETPTDTPPPEAAVIGLDVARDVTHDPLA